MLLLLRPLGFLLSAKDFSERSPHHRATVRSGASCKKTQKRFVDLRGIRFLSEEKVAKQFDNRHEYGYQENPSPRSFGAHDSEQHGRGEHEHGSQQQVADFDVECAGANAENRAQYVDAPIATGP